MASQLTHGDFRQLTTLKIHCIKPLTHPSPLPHSGNKYNQTTLLVTFVSIWVPRPADSYILAAVKIMNYGLVLRLGNEMFTLM